MNVGMAGLMVLLVSARAMDSASAADTNHMPRSLEPYVVDGALTFGEFEWLRWGFSKHGPEKAHWQQIARWANDVATARKSKAAEAVAARGFTLGGAHSNTKRCYDELSCDLVLRAYYIVERLQTWPRFAKALGEARPVFDGYRLAVHAAQDWARSELGAKTLEAQIQVLTVPEQLYRRDVFLLPLSRDEESMLPYRTTVSVRLSEDARFLLQVFFARAFTEEDAKLTAWLKGVMAKSGWPARSDIGNSAWEAAWRIVRHARNDPAFQLDALAALQPLIKNNKMGNDEYASRVDAILLEVTGKQRYGTQVICRDGKPALAPVESETALDKHRADVGLPPVGDQQSNVPSTYCK